MPSGVVSVGSCCLGAWYYPSWRNKSASLYPSLYWVDSVGITGKWGWTEQCLYTNATAAEVSGI